jgi:hypothetical protein
MGWYIGRRPRWEVVKHRMQDLGTLSSAGYRSIETPAPVKHGSTGNALSACGLQGS